MSFQELFKEIRSCTKCVASKTRKNIVLGKGNLQSELLLIGESPGFSEDETGKPFCGRSGKLLDQCLNVLTVKNPAITNVCRCRPITSEGKNRKPTDEEVSNCADFLDRHIKTQQPKVIVLLGGTALNRFFPKAKLIQNYGKVLLHKDYPGVKFFVSLHPSYILRGNYTPEKYINDFNIVNEIFSGTPIEDINDKAPKLPSKKKKLIQDEPKFEDVLPQRYFPLHCHTEFSIGDGARSAKELAVDLANKKFEGCAITDHGSLMAIYECSKEFREKGLQCILGCEFYIVEKETDKINSHITVLVKDEVGYQNLLQLNQLSFDNFYKKPRILLNSLLKFHEGLIVLSGCSNGLFAEKILKNEDVDPLINKFIDTFGDDFYFEVMPHDLNKQRKVNQVLYEKAMEYGVKLVITTDSHYNNLKDKELKNTITAINYNSKIEDVDWGGDTYHNLTTEELETAIKEFYPYLESEIEDMFIHTLEISDKCLYRYPEKFEETLPKIKDAEKILRKKMESKLQEVKDKHGDQIVTERLELEMKRLRDKGFLDYFYIVNDIYHFARENNISYGPGRGSAAASLVSYLLDITKIDPLEYNLLFDRFISEQRKELPDIDMDWGSKEGRQKIIEYLELLYGDESVKHIVTYNTWKTKMALKDVIRITKPELTNEVNEVNKTYGNLLNFKEALKQSPALKNFRIKCPKEFSLARSLEGRIRHIGQHAGGIIVSPNLNKKIPFEFVSSGKKINGRTERLAVTSFEKNALEKLGFVKFDLLVVENVELNKKVADIVGVDLDSIPLDDPNIYKMFRLGLTCGIHQFESYGMNQYTKQVKPDKFKHLVDINCLYRPGPLSAGISQEYIERKEGKPFQYKNKYIKDFTEDTYGLLLTQEQIMFAVNKMAGLSWGEAENIRKIVGKSKGRDVLEEKRSLFVEGCIKNGIDQKQANEVFDEIVGFGAYAFNLSHAVCYSLIAYQSAWLKYHYPVEFYSTLLEMKSDENQLRDIIIESKKAKIKVYPPSFERLGKPLYNSNTKEIWLSPILLDGLGEKVYQKLLEIEDPTFKKIKKSLGNKSLTILIKSGYFDCLEPNRKKLLESKDLKQQPLFEVEEVDFTEDEKYEMLYEYLKCWKDL